MHGKVRQMKKKKKTNDGCQMRAHGVRKKDVRPEQALVPIARLEERSGREAQAQPRVDDVVYQAKRVDVKKIKERELFV